MIRKSIFCQANRGMAVVIVLSMCAFLLSLTVALLTMNKENKVVDLNVREMLKVNYLAKGAIQIALLKVRCLPTEFYDANKWKIGNLVPDPYLVGSQPQPGQNYILGIKPQGINQSDHYLEFFVTGKVNGVTPNPVTEDLYGELSVANGDPFNGQFRITSMKLISQKNMNFMDGIEIQAQAFVETGKDLNKDGRVDTRQGLLTEFHRIKWLMEIVN